ncbi:hypothetical protein DPSP01_005119 [Paraphaeosphaeria sporulosa]
MSIQGSVAYNFVSSNQVPVFSQEPVLDRHAMLPLAAGSSSRKRNLSQGGCSLGMHSMFQTPELNICTVSASRYLQLQARKTDEVFKMNEATLAKTSDLFKYALYRSPWSPASPGPGNKDTPPAADELPSSAQSSNKLIPSTTISPTIPIVRLNTTPSALFLNCLWAVARPDHLSMYLDSTIPRPSYDFTLYL